MKVAVFVGLCLLTAGCELEQREARSDPVAARSASPEDDEDPRTVDPGLMADCVEFTQTAAYVGNFDYTGLWDEAGHDADVLRGMCAEFSVETLESIAADRADFDLYVASATTLSPPPLPFAAGAAVETGPCSSSYSGACVPMASDVDCGGGEGDGPAFLWEVATVVSGDPYGLDSDGDGLACEPSGWGG